VREHRVAGERVQRAGHQGRHEERFGEREALPHRIEGVSVQEGLGLRDEVSKAGDHDPGESARVGVVGEQVGEVGDERP
jgi:hypothetical protein